VLFFSLTKNVELDVHFVRERMALGDIRVLHVPTRQQLADVMTKELPMNVFQEFRSSLCVATDDVTTAAPHVPSPCPLTRSHALL
jgi:hypothetical protein